MAKPDNLIDNIRAQKRAATTRRFSRSSERHPYRPNLIRKQ
jgi:hypothetical protein